ncbi:MAG: hypothetical protein V1702_00155 [Candidatus Woesearchaeota archaeon]
MGIFSRLQAKRNEFGEQNMPGGLGFHCSAFIASLPTPEKRLSPHEKDYVAKGVAAILAETSKDTPMSISNIADVFDKRYYPVPYYSPLAGLCAFLPHDLAYYGALQLVKQRAAKFSQEPGTVRVYLARNHKAQI